MRATPRPGISLRDLLPEADAAPAVNSVPAGETLLSVENLVKEYPRQGATSSMARLFGREVEEAPFRAVDGISFDVKRGESVGLVGESGCGKSTTSTIVMRLLDPTSGRITFKGQDIGAVPANEFARNPLRSKIQMVFQDPTDSLNPRYTAARAIADPILRMGGSMRSGR